MLNDIVDDKATKSHNNSGFASSAAPYQAGTGPGIAGYLDGSKDASLAGKGDSDRKAPRKSNSQRNSNQLDQLRHEIELEDLERAEQRRLEQAILQAEEAKSNDQTMPSHLNGSTHEIKKEGTRSQLATFNDMSNIVRIQNDSSQDISMM